MFTRDIYYMARAIRVSLICNIFLFSIKAVSLVFVNSLAITVDLGISFIGLTVSVILLYSMKMSNKPADPLHNYGYGKVENVCEAMEGVVLTGIALAMSTQAILGLLRPVHVELPLLGLSTSFVNSLINFGGAYYISKMGRKSNSPAVCAEGVHYKLEGFISSIIAGSFVISILLDNFGYSHIAGYIDPAAALLVSIVIIVPSLKITKTSFFKLLDASIEESSQIEILKHLGMFTDKYCEFCDIKTRAAGRKKFIEFGLVLPKSFPFEKASQIALELEHNIKRSIKNAEVNIRMIPCAADCKFNEDMSKCPYM